MLGEPSSQRPAVPGSRGPATWGRAALAWVALQAVWLGVPAGAQVQVTGTFAQDWPFPPGAEFDDRLRRIIPDGLRSAASATDLVNFGRATLDRIAGTQVDARLHNGVTMESNQINVDFGLNVAAGQETTFHLDTRLHPGGYAIERIWLMFGNKLTGDLRAYRLSYSRVGDEGFSLAATRRAGTANNTWSLANWGTDTWLGTGGQPLWTNVDAIRFEWQDVNPPAGWGFKVWEVDVFGTGTDTLPPGTGYVWCGDGVLDGGTGVWSQPAARWKDNGRVGTLRTNATARFPVPAGEVTIDPDGVAPTAGLAFEAATEYVVAGGTLTLAGTTATANRIGVAAAATATISAPVAGSAGFEKTGPGTLALSGQSTYTGTTTVADGVLRLADGDDRLATTGSIVVTGPGILDVGFGTQRTGGVLLTGGTIRTGTLESTTAYQLEAGTVSATLAGTVGAVKSGFGSVLLSGINTYSGATTIAAGTLELGEFGSLGAGSYAGAIANAADFVVSTAAEQVLSGPISGTGRLLKAGFGRLTLSGSNTYSGPTTVSGGTLLVNGTNAGAGPVTTSFGTILGGSGRIDADTTVGGLHSPGNSPGVQTFGGDLTYGVGTTVLWELAANTASGRGTLFDGIDVEGDLAFPAFGTTTLELNFASAGTVDWSNGFWGDSRQWVIYEVAGAMTDAANLTLLTDNWMDASGQFFTDIRPASSFALQASPATGEIILSYTAPVPEPAVLGVAGIAATAFLARRLWRRRRRGDC